MLKIKPLVSAIAFATLSVQGSAFAQTDQSDQRTESVENVEEIIVYGLRDSLANARNQERFSNNLKNVIAAEAVGKLPDANIAEALNRVSSIYLQPDQGEGRYVSIRGVDPILNNVTFNGQTIAVSDSDGRSGRAAPLDVLSASSVSFIEVHKVTLPDMDGQSIGGTINVRTPSAFSFEDTYASFNADMGSNDLADNADIYSYGGDFATRFGANEELGIYVSANYWMREYVSHLYENPVVGNSANGVLEDRLFPDRVRFGSAIGERERSNFTANLEFHPEGSSNEFWARYYWTEYNDEELRPEFTIRNRGDIGAVNEREFFWTRYRIENETRHERQERPVDQIVFGGDIALTESWRLDGNVNWTNAKELNPWLNYYESETQSDSGDLTNGVANNPIRFALDDNGFATPYYNAAFSNGLTPEDMAFHEMSRYRDIKSNVEEDTFTADLNATWEGELGGKFTTFQTGFKLINRDKVVDDTDERYPYQGSENLATAGTGALFSEIGMGQTYDLLQRGVRIPVPSSAAYQQYFFANRDDFVFDAAGARSNSVEDDYTMDEEISSVYAMASVDLSARFNLTGGVRVEQTDVTVSAFSFVNEVETTHPDGVTQIDSLPFGTSDILVTRGEHDYTTVLPSLVARYELTPEWLLRASFSSNLGRPDYPDTAPISTLSVSEDELVPGIFYASNQIGNPDLEPYEGTNYDLSLDYYFPEGNGVVSFGAFYKRIENAIYSFNQQFFDYNFAGVNFDEYNSSTLDNAEPGKIQGLEIGLQYDFIGLPEPFDGFGTSINGAFIDSEVEVSQRPGEKLPFFNQADNTYNIQFYYEKYGFQARLAWSYQSEALFDEITASAEEDIFRAERETLDLKLSYQINDSLRVFVSGRNLGDEPDLTYRNRNTFFIAENPGYETYGREYRMGLTWALR